MLKSRVDALQGSLDLLVLKILSRRPGLHGYGIMTAIQAASGEVLRAEEGSLYPALHRMEEAGWIKAKWITRIPAAARAFMNSPPEARSSSPRWNRAGNPPPRP